MGPGLALHSLLAGGHGKQPTVKKQPAPALPSLPGRPDPRVGALMTLLKSQQQPAPAPQGRMGEPVPPKAPKKPVQQKPPDSTDLP